MTDFRALGARLGVALAKLVPPAAAEQIRASYAKRFGVCRVCREPLGGPSPEQICEECHAGEVLGEAIGGDDAPSA